MFYCGIDSGTSWVGYTLLQSDGRIVRSGSVELKSPSKLKGDDALFARLFQLATWAESFFCELPANTLVGVEHSWVGKNVQTAITLGIGFGYIASAAQRHGFNVEKIEPSEAKMALAGRGNAPKSLMILLAKDLGACKKDYKGKEDEADSVGVGLALRSKHIGST